MTDPLSPLAHGSAADAAPSAIPPRRRSPGLFVLLVFVLSIPFWAAGAATRVRLMPGLPVSALAVVCPAVAASLLVFRSGGSAAVNALLKRSFDAARIPSKHWYLPVVLLMPAVTVAAYGVMRWLELPLPEPEVPLLPAIAVFVASFVGALGEELGWSGYAIDPLQERWGALRAAVVLGLVWAAWHLIALVQANRSAAWIAWWCLYTVAGRVVLTWLYDNTGGSVFAAAVYHAMSNLSWQMFPNRSSHWDPRVVGLVYAGVAVFITVIWGPRTLTRNGAARARAVRGSAS